jgi:plastocyanin/DNA-binding beta-propeller fold protein YncE
MARQAVRLLMALALPSLPVTHAQQTPVGEALDADDIERQYDLCGTAGSGEPTMRLSDYDGTRNGGSYTVLAVATFFTGCSPGRFVAPAFAEFCAQQKLLHGDSFQCVTSLKGSSSCESWSRLYHDVDGDTSNDDANIPLVVTDTTSALHYTLFNGNPQFALIDKNMVVRHLVQGAPAQEAATIEGLGDMVAQLVAEDAAAAGAPDAVAAGAGQTIEVGGDAGWVVQPGNAVYEPIAANIGDRIVFAYNDYYHDVMLVDNENCDFSSGTILDETGFLEFEITSAGTYTFACSRGDHCAVGNQQVTVTVGGSASESQPGDASSASCAPAFGLQNAVIVEFTNDEGLDNPRDLQFHPLNPNELWVANNDTDSITIIDTVAGTAVTRRDRAPYHYMERISSLAFDSRGYFATCQESENSYNDMMIPNWFMGPTLFHSDPEDLIDQLGESGCDTSDPDRTCFFTHWDMLHESPLCMGITHDPETETPFGNVYWAFDGLNSSLIRYDFQEPHGPGSLDHSIAAIRRYPEIELTRVPGIPGHLMVDPTERVLYIADTGGGRILRMDPDSGHFIRTAKREFPIYSSTAETFEYSIYGCTDWEVFVDGLDNPSGMHVDGSHVYVGEWGSSSIIAFDKSTREEVSRINTGAAGLNGFAMDTSGQFWFSDGPSNTVAKVEVEVPCADAAPGSAARIDWPVRECTMVVDNDLTVDHVAHGAGYMNLTGFLGIADYADAEVHHCGGNSVTLSAAMAGMPTADLDGNFRMNNDALLMEGYLCHVCLPEPCANGGVCSHIPWGFTCDCSGTGFGGDTCETPAADEPACWLSGDLDASLRVDVSDILMLLAQYGRRADDVGQSRDLLGDINSDAYVGVDDLLLVLSQFGSSCDAGR